MNFIPYQIEIEESEKILNPSENLVPHIILERKAVYEYLTIKTRSEPQVRHLMQQKLSDMRDAGWFIFDKVQTLSSSSPKER